MTEEAYNPISCSLHDELLSLATLRRVVPVVWKGADGTEHQTDEKIVDVFSRQTQEFLQLSSGREIRLDKLVRVDGKEFGGVC
ncbi:MAG: hypothetical protein IPM61_01995 [Chlorobi bacterium]|nr:hypothetical protein [Chlorobiota bacterium]MBX7218269.1 hypothetical protein [Candidatus Kapabacteria bacterium]MCE7935198.1 hypothetical protein [Chlorobi bacterium CHB2]